MSARRVRLRLLAPAALAGALAGSLSAPVAAQRVRVAVSPDTATVGDVVSAAIRVELPPGFRAVVPDTLPVTEKVENAGRVRRMEEELPQGGTQLTAVYPVTAWRPGVDSLPTVQVRVIGPGVDRLIPAALPPIRVRSVLPADTAGVEPRPPKDVLGANRLLWPWLLLGLLLLLLLAALGYWLWKRRRSRPEPEALPEVLSPRERALRELDRLREEELVARGESKLFYSRATEAVRRYLDVLDPRWSADLTTSELVPSVRRDVDAAVAGELGRLLSAADLVKFARRRPSPADAYAEWEALRRWVAEFPEARPEPVEAAPVPEAA
jgi:hypothetical protein